MPVTETRKFGSETTTRGVRIAAAPFFIPEQSDPASDRYVFGYTIRVTNDGDKTCRLVSRRWVIVDGDGERKIVEGEGVVGRQPEIKPGQTFQYSSFCPLPTSWGTMEGEYTMELGDGETFEAKIGRFILASK